MYTLIKSIVCLLFVGLLSRLALVSTGLFLRVQIADKTGKTSSKSYELNTAHPDLTNLVTMAGAAGLSSVADIIARLAAVTKGAVVGYSIGEGFIEDTVEFGLGERFEKATCSAGIDGQLKKKATFAIPAPADTIFINDSAQGPEADTVDPADAALIAYAQVFQATSLTSTGQGAALISDGEQLADNPVVKGRRV